MSQLFYQYILTFIKIKKNMFSFYDNLIVFIFVIRLMEKPLMRGMQVGLLIGHEESRHGAFALKIFNVAVVV